MILPKMIRSLKLYSGDNVRELHKHQGTFSLFINVNAISVACCIAKLQIFIYIQSLHSVYLHYGKSVMFTQADLLSFIFLHIVDMLVKYAHFFRDIHCHKILSLKKVTRHPKLQFYSGVPKLNWSISLIDIKFKKCRVAHVTQHALRVFWLHTMALYAH